MSKKAKSSGFAHDLICAIPRLRDYAGALCSSADDRDDIVQTALTNAWAHQDRYKPGTDMPAWLTTILRNAFYDQCRKRRWELPDPDGRYAQRLTVLPEQQSRADLSDVCRAFAGLLPQDSEALLLVVSTGLSCDALARSRGMAGSTVRSRVQRARARLTDALRLEPGEAYGESELMQAALQAPGLSP